MPSAAPPAIGAAYDSPVGIDLGVPVVGPFSAVSEPIFASKMKSAFIHHLQNGSGEFSKFRKVVAKRQLIFEFPNRILLSECL